MTPKPWDWTEARARVAAIGGRAPGRIGELDQALSMIRQHMDVEQVPVDRSHAASLWLGARLAIDCLTPLLHAAAGADPDAHAHILSHIDAVEEIACAALDLWPERPAAPGGPDRPTSRPSGLLGSVERLRDDHERGDP